MKIRTVVLCIALGACTSPPHTDLRSVPLTAPTDLQSVAPRPAFPATPSTAPTDLGSTTTPQPASRAGGVGTPAPTGGAPGGADGTWSFAAQKVAKDASCADQPVARLTAKGPATETYAVACTNGMLMTIRCDNGQCRPLPDAASR